MTRQQEVHATRPEPASSPGPRHLTRIVATLGPASQAESGVRALIRAGTDIFRLNFSHGSHEQHARTYETIRRVAAEEHTNPAILQDIPGPKLRMHEFADGEVELTTGNSFRLQRNLVEGDEDAVGFESDGWHRSVRPGDRVVIGDGDVQLEVTSVDDDGLSTTVSAGGLVRSRQGINFPDSDLDLTAVTDEDWDHISFGLELGVDAIALSFVQGPEDLIAVRRYVQRKGGDGPLLVAKIETPRAVENIHQIIHRCDGVMVARGDLGITLPIERIPVIQKHIIQLAREHRTFVITATQMLESMTTNTRPTRAEATDVANAVYDGTDGVMLSGETAIGKHPPQVVETMGNILKTAEPVAYIPALHREDHTVDSAVSTAVKTLAAQLEARAILCPLSSGSTAVRMSRQRMGIPILVGTTNDRTARRLLFHQGVFPVTVETSHQLMENSFRLINEAKQRGFIRDGDPVVLTGGLPPERAGTTNFLRALVVGDDL